MKKELRDYLHLYIGCSCQRMGEVDEDDKPKVSILTGVSYDDTQKEWWAYFGENEERDYSSVSDVFPILRPLSSMTEQEKNEACSEWQKGEQYQIVYLLSKHFDIFGLIDARLAIDSTSISEEAKERAAHTMKLK